MRIERLDHLVLTVADIGSTIDFYVKALGFEPIEHGGRHALRYGRQKINLHEAGREFEPKAARPAPGAGDLSFIAAGVLADVAAHLAAAGIAVEKGPVARTWALGPMRSLYLRDPHHNRMDNAVYDTPAAEENSPA